MAYFHCKNGNGGVAGVGTITVQATQGTVITCTKSGTTLTKTVGASQEVVFDVPESGAWVVSNGTKLETITIEPQDYNVSFLFDPVLYDNGTFNAEYENPGEFTYSSYSTRSGGATLGNNKITLYSGDVNTSYRVFGFSNKIDFSSFSKIKITLGSSASTPVEFDISELSGERYIAFCGTKNQSGNSYFYIYVPTTKDTSTCGRTERSMLGSGTNYIDIFKVELIE